MPVARYFVALLAILGALYAGVFLGGDDLTPKLGLDLRGGTTVTLRALTADGDAPSSEDLEVARGIIEDRVNGLGVASAEVTTEGDRNIVISVPAAGGNDVQQLGATALLEMRPVVQVLPPDNAAQTDPNAPATDAPATDAPATDAPAPAGADGDTQSVPQGADTMEGAVAIAPQLDCARVNVNATPPTPEQFMVSCGTTGEKYILGPVIVKGTQITDAAAGLDVQGGQGWVVSVDFDNAGRNAWADYTAANVGKQTAFVLDQRVLTAPVIQGRIDGTTQITGQFNQESSTSLANSLKYGALPLNFTQSEARQVSATLGLEQLEAGLLAGAIGLALVVVYCLLYYRLLGLLTVASLVVSGVLVYAVLVLLSRGVGLTLTLSGIAGFIVAIGITADSFVVYFERLKDEVRDGRSMRSAVPRAWTRARKTILSADAVSVIAAVILYLMTVGEVRGFAFTLGLSTVLDLIVVFLFTHPLMSWLSRFPIFASPLISGLGRSVHTGRITKEATDGDKSTAKERAAARRAAAREQEEADAEAEAAK
jgi:preprotein translocase subunit SecD